MVMTEPSDGWNRPPENPKPPMILVEASDDTNLERPVESDTANCFLSAIQVNSQKGFRWLLLAADHPGEALVTTSKSVDPFHFPVRGDQVDDRPRLSPMRQF
jgi:hypothetical protein